MLAVVWSHASNMAFFREGDFSVTPLFSACLVTFAVPAFFLLSGYLLRLHACLRPEGVPFARRPARQMRRLLPPFLAWNALTLLSLKVLYGVPLGHWQRLIELAVGSMQLYFIFALLQFLSLACLTDLFATPRRIAGWTVAGLAATIAFYALSSLLYAVSSPRDYAFELVGIRLAPAWAGFFFLGAWLAGRQEMLPSLTRRLPLLLLATGLAFAAYLHEVAAEATLLGVNYRQYFLLSGLCFQILGALTLCCACQWAEKRANGRVFHALAAPAFRGCVKSWGETFLKKSFPPGPPSKDFNNCTGMVVASLSIMKLRKGRAREGRTLFKGFPLSHPSFTSF